MPCVNVACIKLYLSVGTFMKLMNLYFFPSEAILQRVLQEFISVISGWITSYPPCG